MPRSPGSHQPSLVATSSAARLPTDGEQYRYLSATAPSGTLT
jgi:hypothetical protein